MKHNYLIVGTLLLLLNGTLAWAFGQTSLTPAPTSAECGQADNSIYRDELALQLPNRSTTAKRIAQERYAFLKWIESRIPDFYLLQSDVKDDTLLFPVGRSDWAYALELPYDGYRVSCYQRMDGKYHLVYRVNLERRDRIVIKRRPANRIARIASLLDFLTAEQVVPEGVSGRVREHAIRYTIRGAISKFATSDLSAKRDYAEYDVFLGVGWLVVSLFPANQADAYATGDAYDPDYDPYRKINLEDDQFYQKYGLPVAKAELPLLP